MFGKTLRNKATCLFLLICALLCVSCGGGASGSLFAFSILGSWTGVLRQDGGVICRGNDGEVFTLTVGFGTEVARVMYSIQPQSGDDSDGDSDSEGEAVLVLRQSEDTDSLCQLQGIRQSDADLVVRPLPDQCDEAFLNKITFVFRSSQEADVRENFDVPGESDPETGAALCVINTAGDLLGGGAVSRSMESAI